MPYVCPDDTVRNQLAKTVKHAAAEEPNMLLGHEHFWLNMLEIERQNYNNCGKNS